MGHETRLGRYLDNVAARKPARYYPWILGGLIILYLAVIPFLKAYIIVFVPVAVAGWFYYRRGGFIASVLAFIVDLFLISTFAGKLDWNVVISLEKGILLGHLYIFIVGIGFGYLREVFEERHQIVKQTLSRERLLTIINMATRDVMKSKKPEEANYLLLNYLTNLFVADHGYLFLWSDTRKEVILASATTTFEKQLSNKVLHTAEAVMILSALDSGHILIVDHVQESFYDKNPALFKEKQISIKSAILVPLVVEDYKIGVVTLTFNSSRNFDREEISYMELAISQITLALRGIAQEREIEKRLNQAKAINSITYVLEASERVGLETVLQLIVDSAKNLIPSSKHVVLHLLQDRQNLLIARAVAGFTEGPKSSLRMRLGEGVAGQVASTGETIVIHDVRTDPRFFDQTIPVSFRSLIVTAIKSKNQCLGTISVHSDEIGAFDLDEISLLGTLGTQVAIAIENASLLETTREDLKEINALYHVARNLAISPDASQMITEIVDFLQELFKYYHIQIFLVDPVNGNLVADYGAGKIGSQLKEQEYFLPFGTGIVGHVAETGEVFFTNDVTEVMFYIRNPLLPDTKSEMALPINVDGRVLYVLDIQEISSAAFTLRQMKLLNAITQQLAIALQKEKIFKELQTSLQHEKTMQSQLVQNERLTVAGRLLASVSHELNNPLQAIQNALFLLKDEEKLSAQGSQDLEVILSETERMSSLIGRLRATYRPPRDEDFQNVQLNTIIEDIYALTSTYIRHRKIAFEFRPEPDLPVVSGVEEQIRQAMLNLFMNAIEAMQMAGTLTVQTQSLPDQDQILLSVMDTGPGISPDILPNIFEPFVTNKITGTGLGMTITRDIILQHHGDIQAENNPQGGAVFKIWLPIKKQELI